MKYIYLLFSIIIIYLLYVYYIKNVQENFDPSLVPVSSIITLAKVGQKMVNGGGTLTNPSSLQIGIPSAPGNLFVTGKNTINGTSTFNNNITVNGATNFIGNNTLSGTQHTINGNSTINNGLDISGYLTNNTTDVHARTGDMDTRLGGLWSGPGIYAEGNNNLEVGSGSGNIYIGASDNSVTNNLTVTGNSQINGSYTVNGNSILNGKSTRIGDIYINKPDSTKSQQILIGDGTGWRLRFGANSNNQFIPSVDIYDNGNVYANANIYARNGRNLVDDLYKNITIVSTAYRSSWVTENNSRALDALTRASWAANKDKTFRFQYMAGRDANGNVYDPHVNFQKWLDVTYTCGIGGITKTKTISGADQDTYVTIDCSDALDKPRTIQSIFGLPPR